MSTRKSKPFYSFRLTRQCSVLVVVVYVQALNVSAISVSFGQKPKRQYVKRPTIFGQFLKRPKTKKANGKKANKTKRPLEQYKP